MNTRRPRSRGDLAGPRRRSDREPGRSRILILTASYGEGHNAAARALAEAFDRLDGPGSARVLDVFATDSPRLNAVGRAAYLGMINRTPQLWSRLYRWLDRTRLVERHRWLFGGALRALGDTLRRERPAAVCCTYPVYAMLLAQLRHGGLPIPPVFNVVTDSISIHSLWWRGGCNGWFLPNDESAEVLLHAGVPVRAVHVTGFPVPRFFTANTGVLEPPDLLSGARPRVLHLINSGTRHAAETARRLLVDTDWDITCAVGHDQRLGRRLVRAVGTRHAPTVLLGWTDQVPQLLMTRHVVVSKAGGATTQEAIAARCPMVITQVVPGQEEGNCELLRRSGAGAVAESPDAVLAELRRAFADGGRIWRDWRRALDRLARSDAADRIVRHVLATSWAGSALASPPFSPAAIPSRSDPRA